MKTIIKKDHISLSSCNDINEICKPLEILGIKYFNYSRVAQDLAHTSLSSNGQWAEFFYSQDYKNPFLYSKDTIESVEGCKYVLWAAYPESILLKNLQDFYSLGQGILLIEEGYNYKDFYTFAGARDNHKILNFFINNINILKSFIFYFKEKAEKILNQANQDLIYLPNIKSCKEVMEEECNKLSQENLIIKEFLKEININKYLIFSDVYLTKREMECVYLSLNGKSAKTIGRVLDISYRTVEEYLNNVRQKLSCQSKDELIDKIREYIVNPLEI